MQIKTIEFDDAEVPQTITVTMSLGEAAFLARFAGDISPIDEAKQFGTDGYVHASIYDALVGGLFNRFWDDGVNDVLPKVSAS